MLSAQESAATPQIAEPSSMKNVFRLQRVKYLDVSCAIVRVDGQFRYEKNQAGKSSAWTGKLSTPDLNNLLIMLGADELRNLSQDMIPTQQQAVGPDIDHVLIGVARPGHWQNLDFPTPYSWKPFHKSIDPLLIWYDELRKEPQVKLADQSVNNCMPLPSSPANTSNSIKDLTASTAEDLGNVRTLGLFLLRMHVQTLDGADRESHTKCFIVYTNGRYRFEEDSQRLMNPPKAKVYFNSFGEKELEELRHILDSQGIKDLGQGDTGGPTRFIEGEITEVSIPRQSGTQNLRLINVFGSPHYRPDPTIHAPRTTEALGPLKQWIKQNVERQKVSPVDGGRATECVPTLHDSQEQQ
jgi:hypothetical protein